MPAPLLMVASEGGNCGIIGRPVTVTPPMPEPFLPRREPASRHVELRRLRHHLTEWPGRGPPVVLLHGFMDCGGTFQFVVEAMTDERPCVAPDWRGFGRSAWAADGYWFPDYYADLDALLDVIAPDDPVDVVGHSMGGNIALAYAGLRPERIRRLVTLEGFGLPNADPTLAPDRFRDWLAQVRRPDPAGVFPDFDVLADVLRKRNPRLPPDRAGFVARQWAEALPDGRVETRFDPAHRRVNPILHRRAEAVACWREIRAPVCCVSGDESDLARRHRDEISADALRPYVARLETHLVTGAGHMLHHDQPAAVARIIEEFLAREPV